MTDLLPLPDFSFETPLKPSGQRGKQGDLQWIGLDKLFIDRSYQRDIRQSGKGNIRKICENFHWSLFSPLVVAPRGENKYAIIDGQHRATAAKLHGGIGSLPCLVVHASDREEAKAFAVINGNVTRLASHYIFRGRLAAGESGAVAANRAAENAGVRIMPYPVAAKDLKPNETLAAGTIETCVGKYGEEVVKDSLSVIMGSAKGESGLLAAAIVAALCDVLHANPLWRKQIPEVTAAIAKRGLREIVTGIGSLAGGAKGGIRGELARVFASILTDALSPGGKPEQGTVKTHRQAARQERRAEHAAPKPKRVVIERDKPELRPSRASPRGHDFHVTAPKATVSLNERELIAKHIAEHGVRKLDGTATGNTSNLLDWLNNVCKVKAARVTTSKGALTATKFPYEIEGKRRNLDGLLDIVDRERKKRGLEPVRRKAAT